QDFDLDASVLCLDSNQKLTNVKDVVYFGNLKHQSGAIIHLGDNLTGEGEGDDEVIIVNLSEIPPRISKLVFVVNIYQCLQRKQDFGQVQNAFVRLVNGSNNKELARYDLSGRNYAEMTGMTLAEIYRHKNEWKMAALGNGFRVNGLEEILRKYS
ncbi:MAG: TerD family protein, partial [Crocosphaera sp.]